MSVSGTEIPSANRYVSDQPFGIFNIELTNRCPMKCVMCPRTSHMTRDQGFMEFTLFKKIIDELAVSNKSFLNNRVVWLHHFGESLLHPEFDKFIRYAREKEVLTGLSVNPAMLNGRNPQALLDSGLHILYLSLDGHDNESFFRIRGIKDIYDISRSRVISFLELKKQNPCNMKVFLSMINFSLNEESIASVKNEWSKHEGIDQFLVKEYTTWDGSAPEIKAFTTEPAQVSDPPQNRPITCRFPWENMTVTWDGDVVPCCFDYNKKIVLGRALTRSLSDIWNDQPMQNLREEFLSGEVRNPLCRNCESLRG